MPKAFPYYQQMDAMDCGSTCLRMVAKYYGHSYPAQKLRELTQIGKDGVNLLGISEAAERIGFRTLAVKVPLQKLITEAPLPCIVHWQQNHFVVIAPQPPVGEFFLLAKNWLKGVWGGKGPSTLIHPPFVPPVGGNSSPPTGGTKGGLLVADPARGLITYTYQEFESAWATTTENGQKVGIALLLEPTPRLNPESSLAYSPTGGNKRGAISPPTGGGGGLTSLFSYLWPFKKLLVQLGLGLLVGSVLQLVLPFLTQSVVDTGIQTRNLHFIYLVLLAQMMLFVGRLSVDFIRAWILMHISTRINLSILSDFLAKLLRLPISFLDSKQTGDILQRIGDHSRIESFLTGTSLNTLFSMLSLLVYSAVLAAYNFTIFGVFLLFSVLYVAWIVLFLKYRRQLDYKRFALASQNQSSLIQLITGLQEIKLNNAEHLKRWQWENLQVKQFKLSMKGLAVGQYQQAGAMFLNESKNIIVTFVAATAVVNGQLTLGSMMALQYIVGQMNSPVEQLIQFVQHWQDAKISLERLNEIHEMEDEGEGPSNPPVGGYTSRPTGTNTPPSGGWGATPVGGNTAPLLFLPVGGGGGLTLSNVSFTYPGAGNMPVLKNISLHIPAGKVTAIVGTSGSGKTTLLKLLLKFYEPSPAPRGAITFGGVALSTIAHKLWRSKCGTVLQDGFIFSDSIANNIAVGDESPNIQKLLYAVRIANIQDFIDALPLGYNTKIGAEGNGISQGQRQRLLIARAVYKDPDFLFFDEATNALDANNERVIIENLEEFFRGGSDGRRTVVVVAHRLSTVKNADQIVVMENGEIVEIGTHTELTRQYGKYYELVKNQLELGN